MNAFLHRYRLDASAPSKRSYARDLFVRGLLPALVLLAVAFVVGEYVLPFGGLKNEAALNQSLQATRTPALDLAASVVSHAAGVVGAPVTALIAFWVLRRRTGQWWLALVPLVSVALEALVYQSAALLVGRARPEGVEQMDFGLPDASFPSGHVGASVCLMLSFALLTWSSDAPRAARLGVGLALVAWPLLVGASRLYLGMHHLSDALGGAVIGAVAALIGWWTLRRRGG